MRFPPIVFLYKSHIKKERRLEIPGRLPLLLSMMAWWEQWGRDEDKMFEEALVLTENVPNRFEAIASYLEMPLEVVKHYYDALVRDVELIESDRYGTIDHQDHADGILSPETKHMEKDNKRGRPWTAKEHGLVFKTHELWFSFHLGQERV